MPYTPGLPARGRRACGLLDLCFKEYEKQRSDKPRATTPGAEPAPGAPRFIRNSGACHPPGLRGIRGAGQRKTGARGTPATIANLIQEPATVRATRHPSPVEKRERSKLETREDATLPRTKGGPPACLKVDCRAKPTVHEESCGQCLTPRSAREGKSKRCG